MNCTHQWQQISVDLFRPSIRVRCDHCRAIGEIVDPSRDEITTAFYASPETPLPFAAPERVSNGETKSWAGEV